MNQTPNIKNDLLEPLSVIIKLFIYSFKPIGTKISIYYNRLSIQEKGLFQGFVRTIMRDCKNDINIIIFPIMYACVKYLNSENKSKYLHIFKRVLIGFDNLKETYQGNEIVYNIDQLKTIITNFIDNNNEELSPISFLSTYESVGGQIKQKTYDYLNSVWNDSRISTIFYIIAEILDNSTNIDIQKILLHTLELYMDAIDNVVYNTIYQ